MPPTHRQIPVVHQEIVALVLYQRTVRGPEEESVLGVRRVLSNSLDDLVVSDDGFVVVRTGESLGDGKGAA